MVEKKKFFDVELPLIRKTISLLGNNKAELDGKFVKIDLTRMLRGKSVDIKFKIKADKEKAFGIPISSLLLGFFIRRMIRKGTDYVEASFKTECKDSVLEIKPYLITRKKISRVVRAELRKKAIEYISDYVKEKTSKDIFLGIISNTFQKNISLKLKKVYPLALCEIRVLNILSFKDYKEAEEQAKQVTEIKVEEMPIEVERVEKEVIDQMAEVEAALKEKELKEKLKEKEIAAKATKKE